MNGSFKILLIVLGLLVVVVGIAAIYGYLNYGFLDISKKRPFADVVNKELTLKRDAYIEKVPASSRYFLSETKENANHVYYPLAKGTKIRFKAAQFSRQPHNIGLPFLTGDIYIESLDKTVRFDYHWGSPRYDSSEPGILRTYRIYELAPWQEVALEGEYPYDPRE